MSKTIKTPEYWKEERFQPLVEMETMYGTKVMVPENLMPAWQDYLMHHKDLLRLMPIEERIARGWVTPKSERSKIGTDLRRVFFEIGLEE